MKQVTVLLIAVLFSGGIAEATVTQFYDSDSSSYATTNSAAKKTEFLLLLDDPITEDFENFSEGQVGPLSVAYGILDTSLSADYVFDTDQHPGEDPAAISPTKIFYHHQQDVISIDFSSPQKAFGFYAGDVGDGALSVDPDLVMEITFVDDSTEQVFITTGPGEQRWLYWGITSHEAFKKVSIWGDGGDAFWFDNMTSAVPEPSTITLLSIGALGLLAFSRRKRR